MGEAYFHFYGELNDFLPRSKKQVTFTHYFKEQASIKDMIESLGVPHPEVDYIEVNGEFVDFSYIVANGDACGNKALRINVYPVSASASVTPTLRVGPPHLDVACFVLDIHLGKLATSLRILGFDTLYRNDYVDEELARISATQERILLTRDKGLLMRSLVKHGYYVRETDPHKQVVEVLRRFDLFNSVNPFQRCLRCNGLLEAVDKESLIEQIPQKTRLHIDEFHRCQKCGQIYWKGSHYEQMQQFITKVLNSRP